MNLPPPYPLAWPDEIPRTKSPGASQFRSTLSAAIKNVTDSIRKFGEDSGLRVMGVQVTSNAGLTGVTNGDRGVAVWFIWDQQLRCIAVDRYAKVEDNLQAIHHIIEARRTELRHGGIHVVRATFKGFTLALPAPGSKPWWVVVGVASDATPDQIRAAYRDRARELAAADDQAQLQELNVARDKGLKARS